MSENYVFRHANTRSLITRLRLDFSQVTTALRERLASTVEVFNRPMEGLHTPATIGESEETCNVLLPRGHLDRFTGGFAWANQELPSFSFDSDCVKEFTDITDSSQLSPCHRRVLFPAIYCKFDICAILRSIRQGTMDADGMTMYSDTSIYDAPNG